MVIIDRNVIYCNRGICTKFSKGDVFCEDCPLGKQFEDCHKILCAGCEHRLKAASDITSKNSDADIADCLEYTLNRGETSAEFTPNNGEFCTIFYDGRWEYEDIFHSESYDEGVWTLDTNGKLVIESLYINQLSEHTKSLIKKILQVLGYVKSVA